MGGRGPAYLRKTTNAVLDALLQAAEGATRDQRLGLDVLREIVAGLKASPGFDEFYRRGYRELLEAIESEELEHKRVDAFHRLMIHPIAPLLQDGTFDRDILPNVFSFYQLVLGDDARDWGEDCHETVVRLKEDLGDRFLWDAFYADPAAKRIQWHALVRIAASFKRWDVRQDWFIKLMQYTPTSVSLGQSAFIVKTVGADPTEPWVFTTREFCQFFQAQFTPLTEISPADLDAFRREFGADPHHLIGDFLMHLAACPV